MQEKNEASGTLVNIRDRKRAVQTGRRLVGKVTIPRAGLQASDDCSAGDAAAGKGGAA
jgi:hypothetical protein